MGEGEGEGFHIHHLFENTSDGIGGMIFERSKMSNRCSFSPGEKARMRADVGQNKNRAPWRTRG
jgi:hypothetical protein